MAEPIPVLILYGSQHGNSQAIAEQISHDIDRRVAQQRTVANFSCAVGPMKDFETLSWRKKKLVLFVCSTTGEGEFPDNALAFHRFIKKKAHPVDLLAGMRYAVLALGDTNYEKFCNAGKILDRRLEELGAQRFYARGDADDGTTLELVVEPWIDNLWPSLDLAAQRSQFEGLDEDRTILDEDDSDGLPFPLQISSYQVHLQCAIASTGEAQRQHRGNPAHVTQ